jgi:hypothetical protein
MSPQSTWPGHDGISCVILSFPDSTTGDTFLVKDFHLYANAEYNPPNFYQTTNNGSTVTRIPTGDTDSWELIDDFPPTADADHIYMNTDILSTMVRGGQDDGKTHLPPQFSDSYLEYRYGSYGEEARIFGVKILLGIKSYNGMNDFNGNTDYEDYSMTGTNTMVESDEDGNYRFAGNYPSADSDLTTLHGVCLSRPPGLGPWTTEKWNAFRTRHGFHDDIFATSVIIIGDYTNSSVVQGLHAEILTFDRRLNPPLCIGPVDLSRIRFRTFETNDVD